MKGIVDRKFLQRNQLKSCEYDIKPYRNTEEGKGIDEREPPQRNNLKPRKRSVKGIIITEYSLDYV